MIRDTAQRSADWIVESNALDPGFERPQCHASSICEVPGGLAVVFFGGPFRGTSEQGIWTMRREAGTWAPARRIAAPRDSSSPLWNPVLHAMPDGSIAHFYKEGGSPADWQGRMQRSIDGGRTWGSGKPLPRRIVGPVRNKPVDLPDGSLLCGSSTELRAWRVHFEKTPDAGSTWSRTKSVRDPDRLAAIQPTLLLWSPGRWQALCRSRARRIVETISENDGRTWSALRTTSLPNPNSAIDALILADGRGLLIFNPTTGSILHANREALAVALSEDAGNTWTIAGTLEEEEGGAFSYPAVLQSQDGLVHVTYTTGARWSGLRHVVIDPRLLSN